MLTPLIINRSYLFAHSPGGECLRTFVRALDRAKFSPTIYASDMQPLVHTECETVITTHEYRSVKYIAAGVRRVLRDLTFLPGYEWWSWGKGAKESILRDIRKGERYDYIHSVSFPCACHTVAKEIKQVTGLPWIMQLYDPWADNPYRNFKTRFFKKYDWQQERECVELADLIIHDNESIADLWRQRYGDKIANKIVVLPLTIPIPKVEVKLAARNNEEPLTISHIGNFMLNRTSLPFIQAVSVFMDRHPEFVGKLKVNYIGNVTEAEKELISRESLDDVFSLVGTIPASQCIEYYAKSDVFLAVDGVNKDNLFFPSKILKYLYFRRPILGITPAGSVLEKELVNAKHVSIRNNDIEGIVKYLETAMTNYVSLLDFDYDYWKRFEPSAVVSEYETLVKKLVSSLA